MVEASEWILGMSDIISIGGSGAVIAAVLLVDYEGMVIVKREQVAVVIVFDVARGHNTNGIIALGQDDNLIQAVERSHLRQPGPS